jgi:hypothetical protein
MKQKLLFVFFFLLSIQVFAQEQKWSVEANYSVVPQDGFGGDADIFELGLKYRVADFGFANLGVSLNGGFSREKFERPDFQIVTKFYYLQPRVFTEFRIPGIERLRPHLALGYSIVSSDSSVIGNFEVFPTSSTNGGFNMNLGLSYDVSKRFFIQAQYDFINLQVRDEFVLQGETVKTDFNQKLNNIKIGLGFRF